MNMKYSALSDTHSCTRNTGKIFQSFSFVNVILSTIVLQVEYFYDRYLKCILLLFYPTYCLLSTMYFRNPTFYNHALI